MCRSVLCSVCATETPLHLQGDLEKQRDGVVFLTVHSLGSSYTSWLNFALDPCMEDIRKRSAGMTLYISRPQDPE